jgi:cation:H+ antiporter
VSQTALRLDIPVMIAVAVLVLPILLTDHCVSRRDGAVFLFYFVAYMSYTVLAAARSELQYSVVGILAVVVPLTVLTLAVGVYQHLRRG